MGSFYQVAVLFFYKSVFGRGLKHPKLKDLRKKVVHSSTVARVIPRKKADENRGERMKQEAYAQLYLPCVL